MLFIMQNQINGEKVEIKLFLADEFLYGSNIFKFSWAYTDTM